MNIVSSSLFKEFHVEHKSSAMRNAIEHIFFSNEPISEDNCTVCNQRVTDFKNLISEREYEISGMCQACQDDIFSDVDDDERI